MKKHSNMLQKFAGKISLCASAKDGEKCHVTIYRVSSIKIQNQANTLGSLSLPLSDCVSWNWLRACVSVWFIICHFSQLFENNTKKKKTKKKKWENCFRIECGPFRPISCTHIHIKWSALATLVGHWNICVTKYTHNENKSIFRYPWKRRRRRRNRRQNGKKQIKSFNQKHKHSHTFTKPTMEMNVEDDVDDEYV